MVWCANIPSALNTLRLSEKSERLDSPFITASRRRASAGANESRMRPKIKTVRQHIAWSCANLGRADAALETGETKYSRIHHIIRNKLYHGLTSGAMNMRPLYDDERLKMKLPQVCSYCGSDKKLSIDHLIPQIKGGPHDADNLVWACRSCNSSKSSKDMMAWMQAKEKFPSIFLLRRYLKIVARFCEENGLMELAVQDEKLKGLPFDLMLVPQSYPPLTELKHWISGFVT